MTYLPLSIAPSIYGQQQVEQEFLQAILAGRCSPAWIIHGPRGVGKSAVAVRVARALLNGRTASHASSQKGGILDFIVTDTLVAQMQNGTHPDFQYLYLGMNRNEDSKKISTNISVDHIRQAKKFLQQTPVQSLRKVLIVDDAHTMGEGAANALLKTLEESSDKALILLVTPCLYQVPLTIISRCRCVGALPLSKRALRRVLTKKFPHLKEEENTLFASMANGSVGMAITYAKHPETTLSLFGLMIDALSKDENSVYVLAKAVTGNDEVKNFTLLESMVSSWIDRLLLSLIKKERFYTISHQEGVAVRKIFKKYTKSELLGFRDTIRRLFSSAQFPLNMDRKSLVITAFLPLHTTGS